MGVCTIGRIGVIQCNICLASNSVQGAKSRFWPRFVPFKPASVRWKAVAPLVLISILKGRKPEGRQQMLLFGFKKNN